MDVVLAVVRVVVVDDKLDVVHVQAAGRHIRSYQNTCGSRPVEGETGFNNRIGGDACSTKLQYRPPPPPIKNSNLKNVIIARPKNGIKMGLNLYLADDLNSPRTQSRSFCCLSP
jgi:hypothetical protein